MTNGRRWPDREAFIVARELVQSLTPVTMRLEFAGSLRRGCATVGDVEILLVPAAKKQHLDLFTTEFIDAAEDEIERLLARGVIRPRQSKLGRFSWGPKNKLAIHCASGLPVDIFATTEANWWTTLVVRTGGKTMSKQLAASAKKLGRKLNPYGCGVTLSDGVVLRAHSEEHLFDLCGVPYLPPEKRP